MVELSKFFKTKRTIYETATFFDQLYHAQKTDNPFDVALAALAKFGELQCYVKVEDTSRALQTAVTAARLFIQNAQFGFEFSKSLPESWSNSLTDGLHCYRVAIDLLKTANKPYLAATMLNEMGKVESDFELTHASGNTYEEAIDVIITGQAPLPLLFTSVLNAIMAYSKIDRYDLALHALQKAQLHFFDNETMWVSPSPIMKRQYRDIQIEHALLLLNVYRYDECLEFIGKNLEPAEVSIIEKMVEASKSSQIYLMDKIIEEARETKIFNNMQIGLLMKHLQFTSREVEAGIFQIMS